MVWFIHPTAMRARFYAVFVVTFYRPSAVCWKVRTYCEIFKRLKIVTHTIDHMLLPSHTISADRRPVLRYNGFLQAM